MKKYLVSGELGAPYKLAFEAVDWDAAVQVTADWLLEIYRDSEESSVYGMLRELDEKSRAMRVEVDRCFAAREAGR